MQVLVKVLPIHFSWRIFGYTLLQSIVNNPGAPCNKHESALHNHQLSAVSYNRHIYAEPGFCLGRLHFFSFFTHRFQKTVHFFPQKVDDLFLVVASKRRSKTTNSSYNLPSTAKNVLKIDSCSAWGCTWCAITNFLPWGRGAGAPTARPGYAYVDIELISHQMSFERNGQM